MCGADEIIISRGTGVYSAESRGTQTVTHHCRGQCPQRYRSGWSIRQISGTKICSPCPWRPGRYCRWQCCYLGSVWSGLRCKRWNTVAKPWVAKTSSYVDDVWKSKVHVVWLTYWYFTSSWSPALYIQRSNEERTGGSLFLHQQPDAGKYRQGSFLGWWNSNFHPSRSLEWNCGNWFSKKEFQRSTLGKKPGLIKYGRVWCCCSDLGYKDVLFQSKTFSTWSGNKNIDRHA